MGPDKAKTWQDNKPRIRYVIAITPRSGSSYLCDLLKASKRFGRPDELINQEFLPNFIKRYGGETPDEYLRNVMRRTQTGNGVTGLKASWFQFSNFIESMDKKAYLKSFRYIYLFRRDLAMQAVSLYKATESGVFHTNIAHGDSSIRKLSHLDYDFEKINYWYKHIEQQEAGWRQFFDARGIFPLTITYEEIDSDPLLTMRRIARFVGVNPENVRMPEKESVFRKVSDERNRDWACRFVLELQTKQKIAQDSGAKSAN